MKQFSILSAYLFFYILAPAQRVGIGTNTPDSSALLEIRSSSQGFLPPRISFAQRNAIPHPAKGLMIWCIDCNEMQVYNGFMWTNLSGAAASVKSIPGVKICYHEWMYYNLAVTTYRNGDPIPVVTDPSAWAGLTTGAMCWYNNDSASNAGRYGALYNWYAITDPRGLAPAGWHLPTHTEWNILCTCLGGSEMAGAKIKDSSLLWQTNTATNNSGFSALPGGYRNESGQFNDSGNYAYWWSSTPISGTSAWSRSVYSGSNAVSTNNSPKTAGYSVRCVKD